MGGSEGQDLMFTGLPLPTFFGKKEGAGVRALNHGRNMAEKVTK